jgi:hypothetical protein
MTHQTSYGSKDICGQSFGQPSPVNRDESTSVLLTSASVQMMSTSVQCMWHTQKVTCVMLTCHHGDVAAPEAAMCHSFLAFSGQSVDQ